MLGYRLLKPSFDSVTVISWLRIGTKYQIEHLRQNAVQCLEACIPTNEYLSFVEAIYKLNNDSPLVIHDVTFFHAIIIINLAPQCDVIQFLPGAFYWCASSLTPAELIAGYEDDDGNQWDLSKQDLSRCLEGQQHLCTALFDRQKTLLKAQLASTCERRENCLSEMHEAREKNRRTPIPEFPDPLNRPSWFDYLCPPCKLHFSGLFEQKASEIWPQLAHFFELDVEWPIGGSGSSA